MHSKFAKRLAFVLILAAIAIFAGYHLSYPVQLNRATLPEQINAHYDLTNSMEGPPAIALYDGVGIGTHEYMILEIRGRFGSVTLERGLTGRYKFTHLGYGGGNFLDGIVESGGKKYLLFGGRDTACQIYKIEVLINGLTYELYPEGTNGRFLSYAEIGPYVEDRHVDRDFVRFYNEQGEDITDLYDLSGGGIQ